MALRLGRGVPGREGPRRRVLIPRKGAQLPQRACNCGFGSRRVLESGGEALGLTLSWAQTFLPPGEVWGRAGTLLGAPHLPQPGFWCQHGAAWHECTRGPGATGDGAPEVPCVPRGCSLSPQASCSPSASCPPSLLLPKAGRTHAGGVRVSEAVPGRRRSPGGSAGCGEVVLGSRERLCHVSLLLIRLSPVSTRHLEHPRARWRGWAGRNVFPRPGSWGGGGWVPAADAFQRRALVIAEKGTGPGSRRCLGVAPSARPRSLLPQVEQPVFPGRFVFGAEVSRAPPPAL